MMSGAIYNDFTQFTTLRADATANPNAAAEEVAAQFESIFLQQMLKSMRDATVKSDLFGSSQMDTYESMADQQLALQLSEQGGIGLARMMVEQMQIRGHIDTDVKDGSGVEPTATIKRESN
jgi:peptidoglycan hydrolase FlgJ